MSRPRRDGKPSRPPDRRKLTDFLINNLKPEIVDGRKKGYLVHDTVKQGLLVHVHSRGS
jgi:hypothetical protein